MPVENYGNFFGQNFFVAAGGVLLIVGVLKGLNYTVGRIGYCESFSSNRNHNNDCRQHSVLILQFYTMIENSIRNMRIEN